MRVMQTASILMEISLVNVILDTQDMVHNVQVYLLLMNNNTCIYSELIVGYNALTIQLSYDTCNNFVQISTNVK